MSTPSTINETLRAMHAQYQKSLPGKLAEISALWEALRHAETLDAATTQTLHRLVHSLTGSGAAFGMSALSHAAKTLELTLKDELQSTERLSTELSNRIQAQWHEVNLAAENPDAAMPEKTSKITLEMEAKAAMKQSSSNILLVEDDLDQARNLELQLSHFGYTVNMLHDTTSLNATIAETNPAVIIMDVVFPDSGMSGPLAITALSEEIKASIPVVFLSSRSDINSRLTSG